MSQLYTPINAHLSFPIYSYNSTASLMNSSDEDGVPTDTVHVNTCARLKVVQVNISKFGNKINNIVLSTGLQGKQIQNIAFLIKVHYVKFLLAWLQGNLLVPLVERKHQQLFSGMADSLVLVFLLQ